ncbi:MAG: hypothetical protein JSS34_02075 [Proteobacteria bacterium]|nr:hypothetical protein [Pseudomonadota bacterium]
MGTQPNSSSDVRAFLFSSWKGRMGLAIGAGLLSCLLSLSFIVNPFLGLIFSTCALLPIFLSGFTLGVEGAVISAITLCIIEGLRGNIVMPLMSMTFIVLAIRQSLLVRRSNGKLFFYPIGRFVTFLLMLTLLFLIGIVVGTKTFFLKSLSLSYHVNFTSFEDLISFYVQEFIKNAGLQAQWGKEGVSLIVNYGLSFLLISWVLHLFVNVMISLSLLKDRSCALRPPFLMQNITLPVWYPCLLVISVGLIFMGEDLSYLGKNASLLVIMGFVFQGCSLVHLQVQKWFKNQVVFQRITLGFFYGSMIIMLPWFLGVAALGILDHFMNLKARLSS